MRENESQKIKEYRTNGEEWIRTKNIYGKEKKLRRKDKRVKWEPERTNENKHNKKNERERANKKKQKRKNKRKKIDYKETLNYLFACN